MKIWLNIYEVAEGQHAPGIEHYSRDYSADRHAVKGRLYCIKVTLK